MAARIFHEGPLVGMGGKAAHAQLIAGRKVSKRRQLRDFEVDRNGPRMLCRLPSQRLIPTGWSASRFSSPDTRRTARETSG